MKKLALVLLLGLAGCLSPQPALAFDVVKCYEQAIKFFQITAPPAIAFLSEDAGYSGYYQFSTISIKESSDCGVLMHEMIHHQQFYNHGPATNGDEWLKREREAAKFDFWYQRTGKHYLQQLYEN